MPRVVCDRCGYEWEITNGRSNPILCGSCRAVPVQTVHTKYGKCLPWQGRFASDWVTPIDDKGEPVLPGERLCGYSDCVNPRHLKTRKKGRMGNGKNTD